MSPKSAEVVPLFGDEPEVGGIEEFPVGRPVARRTAEVRRHRRPRPEWPPEAHPDARRGEHREDNPDAVDRRASRRQQQGDLLRVD